MQKQKEIGFWNFKDIKAWLEDLGLERYSEAFSTLKLIY